MDDITIVPSDNSAVGIAAPTIQPDGSVIYEPNGDIQVGYGEDDVNPSLSWLASLFGNGFNSQSDNTALFKQYMQFIRDNTNYNNSWSAEQAEKQMNFQDLQRRYAELFNSNEAAKNRDWQQFMSSTAHQREVADLKAAGLNPVLSATGGNGASVGSGATASIGQSQGSKGDTDESANMAITSMLSGFLSSMMNLEGHRINAQANLAVADKYNAMTKLIEEMKIDYGKWEHENYPSNMYQAISAILGMLGDDSPSQNALGVAHRAFDEAKKMYEDASNKANSRSFWSSWLKHVLLPGSQFFDGTAKDELKSWTDRFKRIFGK